jgi:hypothetical protein
MGRGAQESLSSSVSRAPEKVGSVRSALVCAQE